MTNNRHAIVLTGAPASGKSDLFEQLKTDQRFSGFLFLEELARTLLQRNPSYRANWHQFHLDIYDLQVKREAALGESNFVTDRGTVDAFAFHPETAEAVNSTITDEYSRYTTVIQLGSSASLGPEHYRTDQIRTESIKEALKIEQAIRACWQDHPGYRFFATETSASDKRKKVISWLCQLIGK